jgi:hypothetical protein
MPRHRARLLLAAILWTAVLTFGPSAVPPLRADPVMAFGPNPRAPDNRSALVPCAAPVGAALHKERLQEVLLNACFLTPQDFQLGPDVTGYSSALVQQSPALFRDHSKPLWNASRANNGAAGPEPGFGCITNSLLFANACLDQGPRPTIATTATPIICATALPLSLSCVRGGAGPAVGDTGWHVYRRS